MGLTDIPFVREQTRGAVVTPDSPLTVEVEVAERGVHNMEEEEDPMAHLNAMRVRAPPARYHRALVRAVNEMLPIFTMHRRRWPPWRRWQKSATCRRRLHIVYKPAWHG